MNEPQVLPPSGLLGLRLRRRVTTRPAIAGFARPGFEAVRDAFVENFERRGELGAACCVYSRGERVVDLQKGQERHWSGRCS